MKIYKIDDNYLDYTLPQTLASKAGIDNIYISYPDRRKKMFAIINMVSKIEKKCNIISWDINSISINDKVYYYLRYLLYDNYLFEVYNYNDTMMAKRYSKLLKIKQKI